MYNEMRSERLPNRTDVRWFHTETVTDDTSEPLIVPAIDRDAAVAVTPGTSARVEYTLSSYDDIKDAAASWHPWPHGDIASPLADAVEGNISALRLVSTGTSGWEVTV